jgi:glycosyltransferase involved in cell wall biosynthesis
MPDRVKVLEVANRYLPDLGGVETHVFEVATRLSTSPLVEIAVAATDRKKEYPAFDLGGAVPILRCRAWPANRDYYFAPGLRRLIRDGGWDVVHVQGIHTLVPVISMMAARKAGIPYVVTFHSGGTSSGLRRVLRGLQWRALAPLLRHATRLVAVSRFEQRRFARAIGVPLERIVVIANGGGLPRPAEPVVPVPGRIVSSGRLERYKGHHRVIEALPIVQRQIPEAHLHILGAGPYEPELRALAQRLGVDQSVTIRLVPPADRNAMAVSLGECAVVAALSDYEAHPVAVMEALALGVPVVGVDAAGIGDLVEDGFVTGVTPSASATDVAQAIVEAMTGPKRAAPALTTWEQAAAKLEQLYVQVGGGGAPAERPAPSLQG